MRPSWREGHRTGFRRCAHAKGQEGVRPLARAHYLDFDSKRRRTSTLGVISFSRFLSRSATQTLAASVGIHAANLMTGILIARVLQATGRGELAAIQLWAAIVAAISLLGLDQASIYFVSRAAPAARRPIILRVLLLSLCLAGLVSLLTLLTSESVPGIKELPASMRTVVAAYVPLNNIAVILVAALLGVGATRYWNFARASVHYFILACIAVVFAFGWRTATSAALAILAGNLCLIIAAALLLKKGLRNGAAGRECVPALRPLLSYGARVQGTALFRLVAERADQLAVALLLGTRALGLYVVALTLLRATTGMIASLEQLAFRRLIDAKTERSRGLVASLLVTLLCGSLLSGALWIVSPIVIPIAFGTEFIEAVEGAQILAWALPPLVGRLLLGALLKSRNAPLLATMIDLLALVALVTALPLAAERGLEGISQAVVGSAWMALLAGGILTSLRLRLDPLASLREDIRWIGDALTKGRG